MQRLGGTLVTGIFFCLTAAIGVTIGRGDMPQFLDRFQQAFAVLCARTEPIHPAGDLRPSPANEPRGESSPDPQFRGALAPPEPSQIVRTAALSSMAIPPGAAGALGYFQEPSPSIKRIALHTANGFDLEWPTTSPAFSPTNTFRIEFAGIESDAQVRINGAPTSEKIAFVSKNVAEITTSGLRNATLVIAKVPGTAVTNEIRISVPGGRVPPPRLTQISNGKFAEFRNVDGLAMPIKVYGGFLRVKAESGSWSGASVSYVRVGPGGAVFGPTSLGKIPDDLKSAAYEFTISDLPKEQVLQPSTLLMIAEGKDGDFSYSSNSITFTTDAAQVASMPAPKIETIDDKSSSDGTFLINKLKIAVTGTPALGEDMQVIIFKETDADPISASAAPSSDGQHFTATIDLSKDPALRQYSLQAALARGSEVGNRSNSAKVVAVTRGPQVKSIIPPNFGTAPGAQKLRIEFSESNPLESESAREEKNYALIGSNGTGRFDLGNEPEVTVTGAAFDSEKNAVTLSFNTNQLRPDLYQLTIRARAVDGATGLKDIYGNFLEGVVGKPGTDYIHVLTQPETTSDDRSKFVTYPEFVDPRPPTVGFNPSDKVDTRVARLYYYRDAHRVAQIINRNLRSLNKAAADTAQQLASKSREIADKATDDRRASERAAVHAAQEARAAEKQLQAAQVVFAVAQQNNTNAQAAVRKSQQQLDAANQESPDPSDPKSAAQIQEKIKRLTGELETNQKSAASNAAQVVTAQQNVTAAQATLQAKRGAEVKANEEAQVKTASEDRAREDQFRKEVAAAHEDPDHFAAGKPKSIDPVEQVSISVIGEGVIQLRGPMKGINEIRMMVNQIDAPVGQVNVAVHTVQVNGEHGDRMETVIGRIEKYIDHSRFLTAQSAQMLRNAVITVASQKAEIAAQMVPEGWHGLPNQSTQEARDRKYLHAFFGKDFIDELQSLDSEFLKTGNKLLTLHSMDSTSLSSALFLLALAKNSVRQEILAQFDYLMRCELPRMEMEYFEAGGGKKAYGCGKFKAFSCNARFTSLMGQFNNQVYNDDTLTPLQREFIRLAQIFKSRLVTEMELNERVMERALIEQRVNQAPAAREAAKAKRSQAKKNLDEATKKRDNAVRTLQSSQNLVTEMQRLLAYAEETFRHSNDPFIESLAKYLTLYDAARADTPIDSFLVTKELKATLDDKTESFWIAKPQADVSCWRIAFTPPIEVGKLPVNDPKKEKQWKAAFNDAIKRQKRQVGLLDAIRFQRKEDDAVSDRLVDEFRKLDRRVASARDDAPLAFSIVFDLVHLAKESKDLDAVVRKGVNGMIKRGAALVEEMRAPNADLNRIYPGWEQLRFDIEKYIADPQRFRGLVASVKEIDAAWKNWLTAQSTIQSEKQQIESADKDDVPFDQKKFLDMLIDEAEDKYIELLEGTRAHTANIDNYIKRLTTALDDDLNTQFYHPAFREVRTASRLWDVSLGDVETASILTNNRAFAKVSPQATMEFDLPKRDILVKEAFAGTKALFDEYGALLQDPTFLALSKLNSGLPTSSPTSGAGSDSPVRNVLPSLPSQTDEKLLGQQGPGNKQFGAALEALIPDPAVYKFETGTGFEIRPVVQPDGQAVTFHFNYMYTTNVREPVRADEKHLGRVKRHFIDTDVQLSNFELRKVSRYQVALKASRTARGVPLLEDVPGVGALFRPLPSAESSLQQNLILAQATIFPTLFDLMGLRWAPAVADLDSLRVTNDDFIVRGRRRDLGNRVFDISSAKVDSFLGIPEGERRTDLYRSQETIPTEHPNGYRGPGLRLRDSQMQEGYNPEEAFPNSKGIRGSDKEGAPRNETGPVIETLDPPNTVPALPAEGATRTKRRTSGSPTQSPIVANEPRRVPENPPVPIRVSPGPTKNRASAPAPLATSARTTEGAVSATPREPRRLAQPGTSGQAKLSDRARPSRVTTETGDIIPAEYTTTEAAPQPKKTGFFSRFRKPEKE